MKEKEILMIPGPTPVPPRVLRAHSNLMINHRGGEFSKLWKEIQDGLKKVFQTKNDIMIFPASGTGAMEASIVNTLSPQDKILAVSIGSFGDRFAEIAKSFGADIIKLDFEWGCGANLNLIEEKLKENKNIKAVLITQNETSTGVTDDLENIAKIVKKFDILLIVDAISALGAIELKTDDWEIDLVVAGSQKALMVPPGLSFVSINEKAWKSYENSKMPKFYWDFKSLKKWMEKSQTPYTPALPQLFGLRESLKIILDEIGLENNFKRHKILGKATREGIKALGLELLCKDENVQSNTVTAILGENIDIESIRKIMREKYGVITAGGQGKLTDKILRIGHLGFISSLDIIATIASLEMALHNTGFKVELGKGVASAEKVFLED